MAFRVSAISSVNSRKTYMLSETRLKPNERFFGPNYCFYWTDCFLGRKAELPLLFERAFPITI
jgi:hypothetical protein